MNIFQLLWSSFTRRYYCIYLPFVL